MQFIFWLIPVLWLFLGLGSATAAENPDVIVLATGHSIEHPAQHSLQISVSDGSIAKVSDLGNRLKITAHKPGETQIRIGAEKLMVYVLNSPEAALYDRLSEVLRTRRGLQLAIVDHRVTVTGHLLRWPDWQALADAAGSSVPYSFAAEVPEELQLHARTVLTQILRSHQLPELSLTLGPSARVTVPADAQDLKSHVEHALGAYGFQIDANANALDLEPMIRVRMIVAEFRKNFSRSLGVTWPTTLSAQVLPSLLLPDPSVLVNVNAFEASGMGRVLASPTLLCRSGKEARFLAGGEIPIKMASFDRQDVMWKQYGVKLGIKPKADFSGRMSIWIETEVSEPDPAHTVDGIPGLTTNRIETHFDLAKSRTIILSGLIKKDVNQSTNGLPWLSRLPILGSLFSSTDFQDDRTELAVFVTPEVIPSGSEEL